MATRTVTGPVYHDDGSPWVGGRVGFELQTAFATATGFYPPENHVETLDASGDFSITLAVPDTGTAYYKIYTPDGLGYTVYLATGAATNLMTLLTLSSVVVDQDAVQTLLDAAAVFDVKTKTSTYIALSSDEYIRCNGTFTVTLPPATGSGMGLALKNIGTGIITVAGDGSDKINGSSVIYMYENEHIALIDAAAAEWDSL
jgi:hypothetical protein